MQSFANRQSYFSSGLHNSITSISEENSYLWVQVRNVGSGKISVFTQLGAGHNERSNIALQVFVITDMLLDIGKWVHTGIRAEILGFSFVVGAYKM